MTGSSGLLNGGLGSEALAKSVVAGNGEVSEVGTVLGAGGEGADGLSGMAALGAGGAVKRHGHALQLGLAAAGRPLHAQLNALSVLADRYTNSRGIGQTGELEGVHLGQVVGVRRELDTIPLDQVAGVVLQKHPSEICRHCWKMTGNIRSVLMSRTEGTRLKEVCQSNGKSEKITQKASFWQGGAFLSCLFHHSFSCDRGKSKKSTTIFLARWCIHSNRVCSAIPFRARLGKSKKSTTSIFLARWCIPFVFILPLLFV